MIFDGKPLKISCLMVTADGRFETLKKSAQNYFKQTYPNKELVVVNEGSKEYQEQIRRQLGGRADVKLLFLDGKYTLGALRNIAIRMCNGEVFCQWDDDDFNAPNRLALQYYHLSRHPTAKISYLSDQLHYYFNTGQLYWESWGDYHSGGILKYSLIPGTIMAYKDGFEHRYPAVGEHCRAGEDTVLAYGICDSSKKVALISGIGNTMIYTYHGKNVWDLDHHLNLSSQRAMPISHMVDNRQKIIETIKTVGLNTPVKVMGREGLAFIYQG